MLLGKPGSNLDPNQIEPRDLVAEQASLIKLTLEKEDASAGPVFAAVNLSIKIFTLELRLK
jgi:hypothetical protein